MKWAKHTMTGDNHTTIPGFTPQMSRLFRYSEPRRPVRAWLRTAALAVVALMLGTPS
jgi:hypothetical protein